MNHRSSPSGVVLGPDYPHVSTRPSHRAGQEPVLICRVGVQALGVPHPGHLQCIEGRAGRTGRDGERKRASSVESKGKSLWSRFPTGNTI